MCTENLTPWLKLLPCGGAGLAHLLAPRAIYAAPFVAQRLAVRRVGVGGSILEVSQTLDLVAPAAASGAARDWALRGLFGDLAVPHRCPVAEQSHIYVLRNAMGVC